MLENGMGIAMTVGENNFYFFMPSFLTEEN